MPLGALPPSGEAEYLVTVLAELSANMSTDEGRSLYAAPARIYKSAAEKVALNPQPLPPLEGQPS